jgi:hypothetical protein
MQGHLNNIVLKSLDKDKPLETPILRSVLPNEPDYHGDQKVKKALCGTETMGLNTLFLR